MRLFHALGGEGQVSQIGGALHQRRADLLSTRCS